MSRRYLKKIIDTIFCLLAHNEQIFKYASKYDEYKHNIQFKMQQATGCPKNEKKG